MTQVTNESPWQVLAPGKVFFNYGPVSMVVMADKNGQPMTDLCTQAFSVIEGGLQELTANLPLLKRYPAQISPPALSAMGRAMLEAVRAVGEPTLTPMATVAGVMSDLVADWLFAQGASRVIANNGGDIALRLAPGESVRVGIMSSLALQKIDRVVTIQAEDGIGGIATSGLGGRSFTRGIAQGVSTFAHRCIMADALATHLANCSYFPSAKVLITKAGNLDPESDIKDLEVVVGVDHLTEEEVTAALAQIDREAVRQKQRGNLLAFCARVQNQIIEKDLPIHS